MADHDFWEIRRESKLNFSTLAGGHYAFFYVRLVYVKIRVVQGQKFLWTVMTQLTSGVRCLFVGSAFC